MADPAREVPPQFWARLASARKNVLMLDYDGTLAPFTVDRLKAAPYPGVREILRDISAAGYTRLVIISGRLLDELFPLLDIEPKPEAWGSHGIVHRYPDGLIETAPIDEATLAALAQAEQWAHVTGYGDSLEVKPGCLALHCRSMSEIEATQLLEAAEKSWHPLVERALKLRRFDGGIELRLSGTDKGSAVNQVLAGGGNDIVAAYLGDDLTDEDAFSALGDRGLKVLVRANLRETLADVWLKPPEQLLQFLEQWHAATSR